MDDLVDGAEDVLDPRASNRDKAMWNAVGDSWIVERPQRVWRKHSDRIAGDLLRQWMKPGVGPALKTDLFDEAVSDGLYGVMSARSGAVHGVDLADSTTSAAAARHPEMTTHVADIRDLPFDDATFETIVSLSTLDHFDTTADIERSLDEIRRVTKIGGRLILTLDNPVNPKIALRAHLGDGFLSRTGLVPYRCGKTLGPRAMRRAVERAGFAVLETEAIVHCPRVTAVWLAGKIGRAETPRLEDALLAALNGFEVLGKLPTRYITGHFSALLAEARD